MPKIGRHVKQKPRTKFLRITLPNNATKTPIKAMVSPMCLLETWEAVSACSTTAMLDNLLLLTSPNSLGTIFQGHVTPSFTTVDLGIFSAGTKLIFELNNQNGRFFYWPSQPQLRQRCSRDCGLSVGAGPNFRGIRGYFRR